MGLLANAATGLAAYGTRDAGRVDQRAAEVLELLALSGVHLILRGVDVRDPGLVHGGPALVKAARAPRNLGAVDVRRA